MKSFGAFLAGLVAVVAFAVALPFGWVATHLADEDGYVSLSRDVLDDDETRASVVSAVTSELDGRARARLIELGVPESLIDRTLAEVDGVVDQGLTNEVVTDAWGEAQRQAHQQMFGPRAGGGFVVEMSPLVAAVASQSGIELEVPASLSVTTDAPAARRAVSMIDASPRLMVGAALVALAAASVAVLLARRRGAAVAWLGAGGLAATGVLHVGAGIAASGAPSGGTSPGDRVALVLLDVARVSFEDLLGRTALVAAGVVVLGLVVVGVGAVRNRTAGP